MPRRPLPSLLVGLSASRTAKLHDRIQWFETLQFGPQIGGMDEEEVRYHVLFRRTGTSGFGRGRTAFVWTGTGAKWTFPCLVAVVRTGYGTRTRPVADEPMKRSGLGAQTGRPMQFRGVKPTFNRM